ncbi:hypothetical protein BH10CYA1_BH10CYA1_30750 [soil metagenome]
MRDKIRGVFKFVVALAIPALLIYFWISAQKMADDQVKDFKDEKSKNPDQTATTVTNYELKEVDDANTVKWHLQAKGGTMQAETKDVALVEVKVEYFDGPKLKMRMSAPTGLANESTRLVKLTSDDKSHVICEGEEGKSRLEASKVELNKDNQFMATGGVNILWPGVAKVTGDKCTGHLDKGAQFENIKIVGNTHSFMGHM